MDKTPRDLVSVAEATRFTGLNAHTLYRLARRGRVRSFKVLRRALRFERSDLLALLHERPAQPGASRSE